VSGPVTLVARVEDVQIFLKDPVYIYIYTHYTPLWWLEYSWNVQLCVPKLIKQTSIVLDLLFKCKNATRWVTSWLCLKRMFPKINGLWSFKMLGTTCQMTQGHNQEALHLQQLHC